MDGSEERARVRKEISADALLSPMSHISISHNAEGEGDGKGEGGPNSGPAEAEGEGDGEGEVSNGFGSVLKVTFTNLSNFSQQQVVCAFTIKERYRDKDIDLQLGLQIKNDDDGDDDDDDDDDDEEEVPGSSSRPSSLGRSVRSNSNSSGKLSPRSVDLTSY